MGLLDQYAKFRDYIAANTPRSTRPVAKPGDVLREGLLDPNKFNAVAANRFKDSMFGLLGGIPGADAPVGFTQGADYFNRGEPVAGAVSVASGVLPFIPATAAGLFTLAKVADRIGAPLPAGPAKKQAGMFIGPKAKTWNADAARQAEEMLAKGIDPREVWKQTGTMKGIDGALRQEIPDNAAAMSGFEPTDEIIAAYNSGGKDAMFARKAELADYERPYRRTNTQEIDNVFNHSQLSDAYPDIFHYGKYQYDYSNPVIGEGAYYANKPDAKYASDLIKLSPADEPTARSGMLHELQHAIQQREGWARGGSPENALDEWYGNINGRLSEIVKGMDEIPEWIRHTDPQKASEYQALRSEYDNLLDMKLGIGDGKPDAHEMYRRLAGEAEARLTQARMGMNMDERLASYPYDMLDVPQEQLIVRGLLK